MTTSPLSVDLRAAPRVDTGLILWLAMFAFVAFCLAFAAALPWITAYPPEWVLPVAAVIDVATDWFTHLFEPFFRAITWSLNGPMRGLRDHPAMDALAGHDPARGRAGAQRQRLAARRSSARSPCSIWSAWAIGCRA